MFITGRRTEDVGEGIAHDGHVLRQHVHGVEARAGSHPVIREDVAAAAEGHSDAVPLIEPIALHPDVRGVGRIVVMRNRAARGIGEAISNDARVMAAGVEQVGESEPGPGDEKAVGFIVGVVEDETLDAGERSADEADVIPRAAIAFGAHRFIIVAAGNVGGIAGNHCVRGFLDRAPRGTGRAGIGIAASGRHVVGSGTTKPGHKYQCEH